MGQGSGLDLLLWGYRDLERLDTPVYRAKKHTAIINCIDGAGGLNQGGAPELVTGSRDGAFVCAGLPSSTVLR